MKKLLTILFAFALGLNLSAQTVSPTYDPDVDGDNNIGVNDLLALLGLFAENDEDDDGIWDSQDDCIGAYDECGVCNGPGPTVSVIESITVLYDSVYAEQIDEWWVYEVGADTVFNYFCVTQLDDTNIHEAVDLWLSDESEALALYGPISAWDVSDVTNMSSLFYEASNFNGDISAWDVSGVTNMYAMFDLASSFNGDISGWDVSSVENMNSMFNLASSFNGDISSWDVSSVIDMYAMFAQASSFNADLTDWDVSSVTKMGWMFHKASIFNGDISAWDVSSVSLMNVMFEQALNFNGDLSSWDVSSVTDMKKMFEEASDFNGDLSSWDVSGVTDMRSMFSGASSFNGDISSWDVSSVTDMHGMFASAHSFNGDISAWDVSNATDISWMFYSANIFNSDISNWNVSNVTTMTTMFYGAPSFNGDLSSWDVSNVTTMNQMFVGADNFNSDISTWDVSSVTNMRWMFYSANIFNSDISSWDVSSVTDMNRMFFEASNFNGDISSWDVSNVTDMTEMFDDTPLSDENKCAIHLSFSANTNWPYEWADFCPFAIFNSCGDDIGYSGYDYATVQIGEQCWFAENLRSEHYANGDVIPGELNDGEWSSTTNGAQAVYAIGASNLTDYGRLYNWYAVDDSRGLCPSGWHVPTDEEFMILEMELGMSESETNGTGWRGTDQGTQMKSSPGDLPSWNGANTSGFSGLAGGYRSYVGNFGVEGDYGYFWSASESGTNALSHVLKSIHTGVGRNANTQRYGFSVRCVRD